MNVKKFFPVHEGLDRLECAHDDFDGADTAIKMGNPKDAAILAFSGVRDLIGHVIVEIPMVLVGPKWGMKPEDR